MCYAYGSIEQATGVCPMCKVFKPTSARCPHVKEVCHNRALHPKHDVVYLKNAEVQNFSGCGFCKWARTNASPKSSGYHNPGWPGCCRPPSANEQRFIGAADWPAVSLVHHVPIPPEVKQLLNSLTGSRTSPSAETAPSANRGLLSQTVATSMVRRASYNVNSSPRPELATMKTAPMAIPAKRRSGESPPQVTSSLISKDSPLADGDVTSSSLPNTSVMDHLARRATIDTHGDRRVDPSANMKSSPGHKYVELAVTLSRRGSGSNQRPSISAAMPSMSLSKVTVDAQPQRRKAPSIGMPAYNPPPAPRPTERQNAATVSRRGGSLEASVEAMNMSSSSSSSSGSGSASETTVISDGGFTDYLSDESEAELQRQAELKAAQLAQNHMEEQEFKAARQQLAHVDLRPPKSWTGNLNNTLPRPQAPPHHLAYQSASYANPPYATAVASSHSRG